MTDRGPDNSHDTLAQVAPLLRSAFTTYTSHFSIFMGISLTRLAPFYVLLTLVPVPDPIMRSIVETVIMVPATAALIRYAWTIISAVDVTASDALLGAAPAATLKLLGTEVIIFSGVMILSFGGPEIFFSLIFLWGWVTLMAAQTVVIEGTMFTDAIQRSLTLVRHAWRLSLAIMLVLAVPEITELVAFSALGRTLAFDITTRVLTLLILPFSAISLTILFDYLASIDLMEKATGRNG
jgi:uncharacterized MnhB-related membrane protein